jgi:hypothetical protein
VRLKSPGSDFRSSWMQEPDAGSSELPELVHRTGLVTAIADFRIFVERSGRTPSGEMAPSAAKGRSAPTSVGGPFHARFQHRPHWQSSLASCRGLDRRLVCTEPARSRRGEVALYAPGRRWARAYRAASHQHATQAVAGRGAHRSRAASKWRTKYRVEVPTSREHLGCGRDLSTRAGCARNRGRPTSAPGQVAASRQSRAAHRSGRDLELRHGLALLRRRG